MEGNSTVDKNLSAGFGAQWRDSPLCLFRNIKRSPLSMCAADILLYYQSGLQIIQAMFLDPTNIETENIYNKMSISYMCVYVYVCLYVYIHIYRYTYINAHIFIYTHLHLYIKIMMHIILIATFIPVPILPATNAPVSTRYHNIWSTIIPFRHWLIVSFFVYISSI